MAVVSNDMSATVKTVSAFVKEQGLSVFLSIILIGFVMWTSVSDTHYRRQQDEKVLEVISANTEALTALREEIRK